MATDSPIYTLSDDEDLFPEIPVATPEQLHAIDEDNSSLELTDGEVDVVPDYELPEELHLFTGSRDKSIHRALKIGNTGEDVEALQRATHRRLEARDIERPIQFDGIFGTQTAAAVDTAAHFLGALNSTTDLSYASIGMQEMIRHPGSRNEDQLTRARNEMTALQKSRAAKDKPKPAPSGAVAKRQAACNAFALAYNHAASVHYTQGSLRWQGINRKLRAAQGQYPNYADCSSIYTWAWWNVIGGGPDILNGAAWSAGYTGTLASHGQRTTALVTGAAVLYGGGWPYTHVAMYIGGGFVLSHGSEVGPLKVAWNYRPVGQVRMHV